MKTDSYIISIDAGTQSIRAVLFDFHGQIIEIHKQPIDSYFSSQAGWAEQSPEYLWKMLCKATQSLIKKLNKTQIASIKSMSLTTQRGTVINLDKNGEPLRNAIIWLDRRQARLEKWPPFWLKLGLKTVNMYETVRYVYKECEANWIRQNENEIWKKTERYLFLSGYFTYKLTGEFVDSIGSMVGYMPFDFKHQNWAKKGHLNKQLFPIEREKLFDLVKPSELLGHISITAARETGLPSGLPIIAAASDKACETLGSGCLTPNVASISCGTTATIQTTRQRYLEIVPFLPPYPSAFPNHFNTEVMIYRGFWMVDWFKREFGLPEVLKAKELNLPPEALFDNMLKETTAGAMGLTLQPYWSPGVKNPGLDAKGAIIGFGDIHTRSHIYRAIIEGIIYALRYGFEKTQKRSNQNIHKIRISGGGSQSDLITQLTADIIGIEVEKPHTYETSALGAAINSAIGLGYYTSFESAVENMVHIKKCFVPIPKNQNIYDQLYQAVYKKLYNKLQPLYQSIRKIVKYPEP